MIDPPLYTRAFWVACAIHFTGALSLSLFVLVPLFVQSMGGTAATIGVLLGLGTAASVATRPAAGMLLDRIGRRRVLLAGGVGNAASWLPFLWVDRVGAWLALWMIVHAIVWGLLFTAYFTYAADLAPAVRRAEGLAVFGVAGMAANGLGPALGEVVIDRGGFDAYFALAAGLALASAGLSLAVVDSGPGVPPRVSTPAGLRHGARHVFRDARLGWVLLATVALGIGINTAFFFVAPYTRAVGLGRAAPFFGAYAATTVLIRLLGRRRMGEIGAHRVAPPAFAAFAAGLTCLWVVVTPAGLVAAGIACGVGHGMLFPVLAALATTRTASASQGSAMAFFTGALDLGAVVGTPIAGGLIEVVGYAGMLGAVAGICLSGAMAMAVDWRSARSCATGGAG